MPQRIKVCHLTSVHKDNDIRVFHKMAYSMANAYELHIVLPNVTNRIEKGVQVHGFKGETQNRRIRMSKTVDALLEVALELKADIYQLHDPELLRISRKLQQSGAKVIFDSHEDVPKQIMDKPWIPWIFRRILSRFYAAYEKRKTQSLDAIISVTPKICKRFSAFHPRVVMVANFPEKHEFMEVNFNLKVATNFCYIGGLFVTRGIREIVQAMHGLNATLHLAGTFSNPELELELQNTPGWENVKYYGQVNRLKIQEILSVSAVGIVTLHPTPSYKEAYPIKLFEYMASGCAILSSNFQEYKDLLKNVNAAIYVDPLSVADIHASLQNCLDNPIETLQHGKEARNGFLSYYNWETESRKLANLYDALLDS